MNRRFFLKSVAAGIAAAAMPAIGVDPVAEAVERYVQWPAKLNPGKQYTLSAWVLEPGAGDGWTRLCKQFTAGVGEKFVRLDLSGPHLQICGAMLEPLNSQENANCVQNSETPTLHNVTITSAHLPVYAIPN